MVFNYYVIMCAFVLKTNNGSFFTACGDIVKRGYGSLGSTSNSISIALKNGCKFIDSAFAYSNGEMIRQSLENNHYLGVITTSKIPGNALDINDLQNSTKRCCKKIFDSFFPTIMYLHGPDCIHKDVLDVVKELPTQPYIGLSNVDLHTLKKVLAKGYIISTVQNEFNPFFWDEELLNYCKENDIVYVGYRPFCGNKGKEELFENQIIQKVANKTGMSVNGVILQWINQKGVTPIAHSNTEINIINNLQLGTELSDEDMIIIDGLKRNEQTCNWKKYLNKELLEKSYEWLN